MNNSLQRNKIWPWFIVPCNVFILAALFKQATGPYWLGPNSDPSYYYLFNFFYLFHNVPLIFTDHPGTPLDLIGGTVVQLMNIGKDAHAGFNALIRNPEIYLQTISWILIAGYIVSLAFIGWYAQRKLGNIFFSFILQISSLLALAVPSYSGHTVLPIIANVNSDTLLMIISNLMIMGLIDLYTREGTQFTDLTVAFGLICAFGITTKLTFLALILLPLILLPHKNRLMFFLVFMGATLILLTPIYSQNTKFLVWLEGLIFKNGAHGSGGNGIIDPVSYCQKLKLIVAIHAWMFIVTLLTLVTSIRHRHPLKKIDRFLFALSTVILVQFLIVAKQGNPQYMMPAVVMFGLMMSLLYLKFQNKFKMAIWWVGACLFVVILMTYLLGYQSKLAAKNRAIFNYAQNLPAKFPGFHICPYYRGSSLPYALAWTNDPPPEYYQLLKEMYPEEYYYDYWYHDFMEFSRIAIPLTEVAENYKGVLLYGTDYKDDLPFSPYTKVIKVDATPQGEAVYMVIDHTSPRAKHFYELSLTMAKSGEYKKALSFAIYSRKLGLNQDLSVYMGMLASQIPDSEKN